MKTSRLALVFVLAVTMLPMVSADPISYWNLDNQTDQIDGNDLTTRGSVNPSGDFPVFNVTGNSSPTSSDFGDYGHINSYNIGNPSNLATNSWANDSITATLWMKFEQPAVTTTYNILPHGGASENDDFSIQYLKSSSAGLSVYVDGGDGGGKTYISPNNIPENEWIFVVGKYNGTHRQIKAYTKNKGTLTNTEAYDANGLDTTSGAEWTIGNYHDGPSGFGGLIDEVRIYDRAITEETEKSLYNGYFTATPTNFTIQAEDAFDQTTINNFTANLTGQTTGTTYDLNTTNRKITTPILSNSTELWTVNVSVSDYFDEDYTDVNVSQNTTLTASLDDNRSKFTQAVTKVTNTSQTVFNITIQGQTFSSNTTFASPDKYNATYTKSGWYNKTQEYNASQNNTFTGVYDAKLNITTAYYEDNQSLAHTGWIAQSNQGYNQSLNSNANNETVVGVEQRPNTPYTARIEPDNYDSPLPIEPFNITVNSSEKDIRKYYYSTYQFNILNEVDGEPFNISSTDSTTVQIRCPNSSQTQIFNSYNKSFAIDCSWRTIKLNVQYPTDSYFRTVIPPFTDRDIDLYALNLDEVLTYQVNLKLNDLTGRYQDGYARVNTYVNGSQEQITSQYFDIEDKVTIYLLKDQTYTLCLYTEDGENTRCLGEFIADSAGTKTITVPQLNLVTGDENAIGDETVTYWDNTNATIKATHQSAEKTTIYFSVNNQANTTIYNVSTTATTGTFTFQKADVNSTYTACITTKAGYSDCRVMPPTYGDYLGFGEYLDEPRQTLNLISIGLILFTLFFIAYINTTAALLITTVELYALMQWNMITWGNTTTDAIIFTVFGFMTAGSFAIEVLRR